MHTICNLKYAYPNCTEYSNKLITNLKFIAVVCIQNSEYRIPPCFFISSPLLRTTVIVHNRFLQENINVNKSCKNQHVALITVVCVVPILTMKNKNNRGEILRKRSIFAFWNRSVTTIPLSSYADKVDMVRRFNRIWAYSIDHTVLMSTKTSSGDVDNGIQLYQKNIFSVMSKYNCISVNFRPPDSVWGLF